MNYRIPFPKLDLPAFNGEEPREWSGKYERYFRIYQIPEKKWVEVATMHFTGKAHRRKEGYLVDKPNINQEELTEAVCRRFGDSGIRKYVTEFNKLTQTGAIEKYQERFEDLRAKILYLNSTLSERHFIKSYISGLKEELILFIDLSHPTTLEKVYEQARLHEQALSIIMRKSRVGFRATGTTFPIRLGLQGEHKPGNQKPPNQLQAANRQLFEHRKAVGYASNAGKSINLDTNVKTRPCT